MEKKLQDAFNEQIKNELYSGYLYLSMSACLDNAGLRGFARWMKAQANEEYSHAMKLYDHMRERGARILLGAIDRPPADFSSALEVFQKTLAHEKQVTAMITDLYNLANSLNDAAASIALQWFVKEQVEEESTASGIVVRLSMIKDKTDAMFILDTELGKRE